LIVFFSVVIFAVFVASNNMATATAEPATLSANFIMITVRLFQLVDCHFNFLFVSLQRLFCQLLLVPPPIPHSTFAVAAGLLARAAVAASSLLPLFPLSPVCYQALPPLPPKTLFPFC